MKWKVFVCSWLWSRRPIMDCCRWLEDFEISISTTTNNMNVAKLLWLCLEDRRLTLHSLRLSIWTDFYLNLILFVFLHHASCSILGRPRSSIYSRILGMYCRTKINPHRCLMSRTFRKEKLGISFVSSITEIIDESALHNVSQTSRDKII